MPAIVTDRLKKEIIQHLISDVKDTSNAYHIGIGQPIQWDQNDTTPTPINHGLSVKDAQYNLIAVKKVEDYSFVIPRRNWSNGSFYRGWNDNFVGHPFQEPFYVITDANGVFVCLQQGRDATGTPLRSTQQPTGGTNGVPFQTQDKYVWKFLYEVGPGRSRLFLTSNYIPVTQFDGAAAGDPTDQISQFNVQQEADSGQVVGYEILSPGTGYSSTPTIEVIGDGSGAEAVAVVHDGSLVDVKVGGPQTDGAAPDRTFGTGYRRASVRIDHASGGGSGASVRAIVGPAAGIGSDPRDDLKATAIMFSAAPEGTEDGAFPVDNDFRQILLIKNIQQADSDGVYTGDAGNALRQMTIGTVTGGPFTPDSRIRGATSQAEAYVVRTDGTSLYYIQDSDTGFKAFQSTPLPETINEIGGQAQTTVTNPLMKGAVDVETGEVIYIDNRTEAVSRSSDQTEDIKVIIDL